MVSLKVFIEENRFNVFLVVLSLAGILMVLVCTSKYGAGVSPDSVSFISLAENVIAGKGYLGYEGRPYVIGAPLFSTLLALFSLGLFEPFHVARFLNAISFGLIILFSGFWLKKYVESVPLVILGSIAVLLSIPLLYVSIFAWTEPVFILLTILFFWVMDLFLKSNKFLWLFLAALFVSFACLTRYIGVTLVLTGFFVLLFERNKGFVKKIKNVILFCIMAILPISIWLVRNYLISSTLTGRRFPSSVTFMQNIGFTLDTVSGWFFPLTIPAVPRILIFGFFIISAVVITMVVILKRKELRKSFNLYCYISLIVFILIYTTWLMVSRSFFAFDTIGHRLMSPVFVPLILLIVVFIDRALRFFDSHFSKKTLRIFLFSAMGLWLLYPLAFDITKIKYSLEQGAGDYSTTPWRQSKLIQYLKKHQLDGQVYSNAPDVFYFFCNVSSRLSPRRYYYNAPASRSDDLSRLREALTAERNTYLVWFKGKFRPFLYSVKKLRYYFEVKKVWSSPDGDIFLIKPNK